MFSSPIFWASLLICAVAVIVYITTIRNLDDHAVWIAGIKHAAHVNEKDCSYSYDCTGHGHFVQVYVKDDAIVADDPDDHQRRPATADEIRGWRRFFDVVPHIPF